ncbi:MAG TPA: Maf family protein [Opitutaceae bacterium]|nr:Maf family protein [Opitutaceae bacterium]
MSAKPKLLLASASPRRRELLKSLGIAFEVVTASVVENEERGTPPRRMVADNAALKADWVASRNPGAVVLGADTTVALDDEALNKPADLASATRMLRRLSGRTHRVFTGVALRQDERNLRLDDVAVAEVTFKPLSDAEINAYLERVHVLDKAGAYAIQEHGEMLVSSYTGELSTIVGLPLSLVKQFLTRAGLLG